MGFFIVLGRTLKRLFIDFLINLLGLLGFLGFLILLTSAISGDDGLGSLPNLLFISINLLDAWRVVKIIELVGIGFLTQIKFILIRREIVLAIILTIAIENISRANNVVTSKIDIVVSVNPEVNKLVIADDKIKGLLSVLLYEISHQL